MAYNFFKSFSDASPHFLGAVASFRGDKKGEAIYAAQASRAAARMQQGQQFMEKQKAANAARKAAASRRATSTDRADAARDESRRRWELQFAERKRAGDLAQAKFDRGPQLRPMTAKEKWELEYKQKTLADMDRGRQAPPNPVQPQSAPVAPTGPLQQSSLPTTNFGPRADPNIRQTADVAPGDPNLKQVAETAPPASPLEAEAAQHELDGQRYEVLGNAASARNSFAKAKAARKRMQKQQEGVLLTKTTKNALGKKAIEENESHARLLQIRKNYKDEYLQAGSRLTNEINNIRDKLGVPGTELNYKEKVKLRNTTRFLRQTQENVNLYIKKITGAQMSEAEADRLQLAVPNAGQAWWQGDGPVKFKSKLDDSIAQATLAKARIYFMRKNNMIQPGFQFEHTRNGKKYGQASPMSLDQIDGVMRKRREELMSDASITDDRARYQNMREKMKAEFNI